jgi:nucleoid DNA-binding protein
MFSSFNYLRHFPLNEPSSPEKEKFEKYFSSANDVYKFCLDKKSLRYAFFTGDNIDAGLGDIFSSFYEQVILKSGSVHTRFMYYRFTNSDPTNEFIYCVYFVLDYVYLSEILDSIGVVVSDDDKSVVLYPGLVGDVCIFNKRFFGKSYSNTIMQSFFELNKKNQIEQKFRIIDKEDCAFNYCAKDLSLLNAMLSQSLENAVVDSRTIQFDNVSRSDFLEFVKMQPDDFDSIATDETSIEDIISNNNDVRVSNINETEVTGVDATKVTDFNNFVENSTDSTSLSSVDDSYVVFKTIEEFLHNLESELNLESDIDSDSFTLYKVKKQFEYKEILFEKGSLVSIRKDKVSNFVFNKTTKKRILFN